MATNPGAPVVAAHFGDTMVLYSEHERVEAVVDGAPPRENGRLFVVEPGKPTKVPYEAGRFMLEHLGYTGVVRVNITESDTGTTYDVKTARKESDAKLAEQDHLRFQRWVSSMVEDYVKRSKPVPAPDDAIQRVIDRRGYDLKKYGIVPIGWAESEKVDEAQVLREQVAKLTQQVQQLTEAATKPAK